MNIKGLRVCEHPTTVVLIDDDRRYLNSLCLRLDRDQALYQPFSNPRRSLDTLKNHHPTPFIQSCISYAEEDNYDHRNIDIHVGAIKNTIYNPKRFAEISVMVIDYVMPGIDGLTFCEQLQHQPFKKLMLTGEADEVLAVNAFNAGLIDRFIRKDAYDFYDLLDDALRELQHEYFQSLSNLVIESLAFSAEHQAFTPFNDPHFIAFFQNFCATHPYKEYYLSDASGSFMFIDSDGQPSWLAVKNKVDMDGVYHLAADADKPLPQATLNALKQKQMMLYLHSDKDFDVDAADWEQHHYLHPTQQLQGLNQTYYYTHINNANAYDIRSAEIVSFNTHKANLTKASE